MSSTKDRTCEKKDCNSCDRIYRCIINLIQSAQSHLVRKLLTDNIFSIVTTHDTELSNIFYKLCNTETLDIKPNNSQENIRKGNSHLTKFTNSISKSILWILHTLSKPKLNWNKVIDKDHDLILVYIPNKKYLELGLPVCMNVEKELKLRPIILHEANQKFLYESFTNLNLSDYPIGILDIIKALAEVLKTKWEITREKQHILFYKLAYKYLWKSQIAYNLYRTKIRQLFHEAKNIKLIFSCLPTTNSARILGSIAEEYNIPVISIDKGPNLYHVEKYFIKTTFLLSKGEKEKFAYTKLGIVNKSRIRVVGLPFIKKIDHYKCNTNEYNKLKVLFIDQPLTVNWNLDCKRQLLIKIAKVAIHFSNIEIVVKLHPGSTDTFIYNEEFQKAGLRYYKIYHKNYMLDDAIAESDYVLMYASTVGFNAIVADKSLIVLGSSFVGLNKFQEDNIFYDKRVAILINNEEELYNTFKCISTKSIKRKTEKEINSFLQDYLAYTGNDSIDQIMKVLKEARKEIK